VAAAVLALESLVFVGVHAKYGEISSIVMSIVLGLLMAFVAYGRRDYLVDFAPARSSH
jgi:hypothetical protein